MVEAGGDGSWSVRALYRIDPLQLTVLPPSSDRGEWSKPCCLDKAITWNRRIVYCNLSHILYQLIFSHYQFFKKNAITAGCPQNIFVWNESYSFKNFVNTFMIPSTIAFCSACVFIAKKDTTIAEGQQTASEERQWSRGSTEVQNTAILPDHHYTSQPTWSSETNCVCWWVACRENYQ